MTLFDVERHARSVVADWDETPVRRALHDLISELVASRSSQGLWPTNPMVGGSIYEGAAGIYWALDALHGRGHGPETPTLPDLLDPSFAAALNAELFKPYGVPVSHSFLLGDTGALLTTYKLTGAFDTDRLLGLIAENRSHPWMEMLWGAPSTLLAAFHGYRLTGDERFVEEVRLGADYLWQRLEYVEEIDCRMWNIDLYGEKSLLTGGGHGFVGNVAAILRMREHFDEGVFSDWRDLIIDFALKTARREEGLANWPPSIGRPRAGRDKILVQWCHGATGFVINLAPLVGTGHDAFDHLMLDAGELIWKAGPLTKYPSLCHGTPGNGYAFLKLYQVTGDKAWLDRARVFAMAAIAGRRARQPYEDSDRFGLWTGDAGLAMYLADCLEAKTDFPTLDYF